MNNKLFPIVFIALSLTACNSLPPAYQEAQLQAAYHQAIADAAVIEPDEITSLKPLQGDTAKVVTWTKYPDSFKPGEDLTLAWGETWVTLDPVVKQRCVDFDKRVLTYRIQQLLGLPPKDETRYFITLEAPTTDMFRPCANASLTAEKCETGFSEASTAMHQSWYAQQTAGAYQTGGFPWTRLGYTYDWAADANEVGVQEYVIKRGATVKVLAIEESSKYCE